MNEEQKAILEKEYRKEKYKKIAVGSAIIIAFVVFAIFILMGKK